LEKACAILKDLLGITISNDEIIEILKEKEIENDLGFE
jgi:hypothetical protein